MLLRKLSFFFTLATFAAPNLHASIDQELDLYIRKFKLAPVEKMAWKKPRLYWAGKMLFWDNVLSGNRNISCRDCHNPAKFSSDAIALSLGQGSINSDHDRRQSEGALIRRHSPALFNLGHKEFTHLFWDGRVSYENGAFQTPEPRLNGPNPQASHITKVLKSALDAQVIFPILSHEEMRGAPGTNEIADEPDNLKAWAMVVERVKNETPKIYQDLADIFPGEDINIGHVARALAHFISLEFQVWNTPYDRYLRGDTSALDEQAKRGMRLFFTKARCGNCHWGKHLTNHKFQSVAIPDISQDGKGLDRGRFELTGDRRDLFAFKNPGLRNVAKTAPYMHNGAFSNLDQVIEHYNSLEASLRLYRVPRVLQAPYRRPLSANNGKDELDEIFSTIFQPFLLRGLGLSIEEKSDLKHFLTRGLTE